MSVAVSPERPLDAIRWSAAGCAVGRFDCPREDPRFADTGPIHDHIFVFPRTSVTITHADADPVVADANAVMFYNRAQEYRRGPIHPDGDRCDWFRVPAEALRDAIRPYDPSVDERPDRPFPFRRGPASPTLYLAQRILVRRLERADAPPDALETQEALFGVLREAVAAAFGADGARSAEEPSPAHRDLARDAQTLLAARFREPWTLDRLATELSTSPFHLSRVFRACTGATIHAYLGRLRLGAALDAIADPRRDLSDLAFELGYSSHSHFTYAFRKAFGRPPSRLRARI